jgi:hypothetical protein
MMIYSQMAAHGYPQDDKWRTLYEEHGRTRFWGTCNYGALWDTILLDHIQRLLCDITGPQNNTQFTLLFFALISYPKARWINLPNFPAVVHRHLEMPK